MIDYDRIFHKYRPRGIRVRWKKRGWRNSHASLEGRDILSPPLDCRVSLYVFLHECAHFHLMHHCPTHAKGNKAFRLAYTGNHRLTLAQQEFEAEMWAMMAMRVEGIKVPRKMTLMAKKYVAECLTLPTTWPHDGVTPTYIVRWATKKGK